MELHRLGSNLSRLPVRNPAEPRTAFRLELLESRTLLATMLWASDSSGDWDVASNWVNAADPSDSHVPTADDDAVIDYSDITVTHDSATSDAVNSLVSQETSSSRRTISIDPSYRRRPRRFPGNST